MMIWIFLMAFFSVGILVGMFLFAFFTPNKVGDAYQQGWNDGYARGWVDGQGET